MASVLQMLPVSSPVLAGALLASVWQGLLLTGVVACGLRILREIPPAARTAVWTAVLMMVLCLPVLSIAGSHGAVATHATVHLPAWWSGVLLMLWASCSLWRAGQLGLSAHHLWAVTRSAVPLEVGPRTAELLRGARPAQLSRPPL